MKSNILNQWLNDRGISNDVIGLFNITDHNHPSIGECIRIPITDTHAKYRRHPLDDRKPKYLYDSGAKVTLYGADKLDVPGTKLLATEGEIDALVAWSQNIPAVSSTGGAMSFQADWVDTLSAYNVYLCFDNDDAGAEGMVRVLKMMPDAHIVLIPETPGVKDISDYVSRGGDLHELLATAKQYPDVASVEADRKQRVATWQSVRFHDKYLDAHRQQERRATYSQASYDGDDEVLKAKTYPMGNLIEFNRNQALCLWHNEKTPSLHYYPKTNSAYCFGSCGKRYDAIDAYMLVHGVGFKEAVKELNDKV